MPENFYFVNSNLIPATENEQAHAGFFTADAAGQRDDFFFPLSPWVSSRLEIGCVGRA